MSAKGTMSDDVITVAKAVDVQYHRLVIVVGPNKAGKSTILREVAHRMAWPLVNVNASLARQMLELTKRERSLRLGSFLAQMVDRGATGTVIDNIELLFDPSLQQDPLQLLRGVSRDRTIVASWNGKIHDRRLVYAEIGHPEYRNYDIHDVHFVDVGEE
jgi:ABC-type cobalamin/Fe3+-siderophores transport system ATPase subunit